MNTLIRRTARLREAGPHGLGRGNRLVRGGTVTVVATSFEDGTIGPFSATGVTIVNDGSDGTKAAEIAADAGFGTHLSIGVVPSHQGQTFDVEAWVKLGGGSFFGQIKSYTEAFGDVNATQMVAVGPTVNGFERYTAHHVAGANTGRTELEMYSFHATIAIRVDDVVFTRSR